MYCVFHRADHDQWQFIAGGGEDKAVKFAKEYETTMQLVEAFVWTFGDSFWLAVN